MERCWNIFKWSFPSCIEFVCTVASGDLLTLRFIVIITSVCAIIELRSVLASPAGHDILLHRTNMQVKYFGNVFRTKNFEWCIFNIFIRFIFHAPTLPLISKKVGHRDDIYLNYWLKLLLQSNYFVFLSFVFLHFQLIIWYSLLITVSLDGVLSQINYKRRNMNVIR